MSRVFRGDREKDQERHFVTSEPGSGRPASIEAQKARTAWHSQNDELEGSRSGTRLVFITYLIISPYGVCDRHRHPPSWSSPSLIQMHTVSLLPSVQLGHGCPYALGRATYLSHKRTPQKLAFQFERTYRPVSPSHPYVLAKLPRA